MEFDYEAFDSDMADFQASIEQDEIAAFFDFGDIPQYDEIEQIFLESEDPIGLDYSSPIFFGVSFCGFFGPARDKP